MSTCPRTDRLLRLLGDDLPESEQTELVAHLDTCPDCRGALDGLAARSGLWHDLSLLRDDPLAPPAVDWSKGPEAQPQDDEDIPVGLLEPPDDPAHLGKLGPYDVLRLIGRGGMGIVFLARDRALDRLVAIKLLTPGMAATGAARRRFAREAKAAAAVVHEHVVTIHAVDTLPQGVPYLVMQYIAGKSVQELIDRGKAPELAEILRIGSQAASALAAAHAHGLIHRDIKPANILLENGVERVKITDFGLARAVDDATMTQSGVVAGTPQYMSPEQAGGERIDHRTDLFSLGSVLYALCTGQAPFRGSSSMATLKRVCEQAPTPIPVFNPAIPPWLVKIIDRLHAKDPADRYDSASDVADLLRRCLAHVQQPDSVPLPAELVLARSRRATALWAAIPVCLLLGTLLCFPWARAVAGQAVSYVATVLRLKTPEGGTLVVETDDPNVGIKLDGSELVVTGAGVKELRLSVGQHNVQALKDGKVLRDELVTISRGGRTVLSVRREAENPQPPPTPTGRFVAPRPVPGEEGNRSAQEFNRLANALKSNPLLPGGPSDAGMRLYMRDLVEGRTTMIADPMVLGLRFIECPSWSHDGRRIICQIQPRINDWSESRVVMIESHDGRVDFRDLGAGCCPNFSPDDQTIAFNLLPGEVPGEPEGVWLMNADGTNRRRVCERGAPFWSPDGSRLLINGWGATTESRDYFFKMYNFVTRRTTRVEVPGRKFWSWPRWTGPSQLVASIGDARRPDSIVLVDVSQPSEAKVVRTLCSQSSGTDVNALWPTISPSSGECFFIGIRGKTRTLYAFTPDDGGRVRLSALESGGPKLTGLSLSGDGRYLLFASNWLDREPRNGAPATVGDRATQEVDRLAGVLRRNPLRHAAKTGARMQLYMRDLLEDRTILIADEPFPGLSWTRAPDWSHDGTRIVFHASPGKGWVNSRLIILEARDGKHSLRDIGAGNCARFSPDDQQLAFVLNDGAVPGEEVGVYLMRADGTNRRRIGNFGAPFWSGDGRQLLINAVGDPTTCNIYTLSTGETETISVPGQKIFSWPRWAGPGMLVACVGTGDEPDSIVLLDVSKPAQARVVDTLWRRGPGQDVYARWPLFSPATGTCYFVGVEGNRRTLLSIRRGAVGRAFAVEGEGHEDELGGLTVSPDGRYLLFGANRPDRAGTPAPASVSTAAAQEALRLAEVLRESPPRPTKGSGTRMQVYLRDLVEDRTTLVADEPILGHVWCGDPDWSHDGTKILFDASTDDRDDPAQRTRSRLMVLERRDGQPRMRDLGPGLCGKFSPDDRRIVFALNPADARDQAGIWVMKTDGTDRTRLITDAYGAPSWSDDRRQLLINTFNDPARSYVYDFPTRQTTQVVVPGQTIFSWPRWAGPHTLVASLGAGNEPVAIDLLDILRPGQARVERRLWRRSDGPDIYARWPLYEPSTGACYFLGARGETRAILKASGGPGKPGAVSIEGGERPNRMGGLSVSPDGRFLVFNADRPDRAAGDHPR